MRFVRLLGLAAVAGTLTCSSSGSSMTGPTTSLPAGSADVTIQDFSFSPATVTIKAGATVRWTNQGPSAHTTTSDTGLWDSGQLNPPSGGGTYGGGTAGASFQMTFTQPGSYRYHCSIHPPALYPGFTGTVVVTQ
jgi:plastocyanin